MNNTLELNIGRKWLTSGLKLVVFELHVTGYPLIARDFGFLQVEDAAIVATIAGGTEILRSLSKPIILDASSSYDPESGAGVLLGMTFSWLGFVLSINNVSGVNNTLKNLSVAVNNTGKIFHSLIDSVFNQSFIQMPDNLFLYSEIGKVTLDAGKLTANRTFYALLTIHKDKRQASALQMVRIHDGRLLNIRIR